MSHDGGILISVFIYQESPRTIKRDDVIINFEMGSRVNMRPTSKNTLLKVVILGDGGVGKSCLMNRFVSNQFDEHSFHTIGVEFLNKDIEIDRETYTLQIWDTAGQERFKTLRTPFYRGSDICMLTYAIDDKHSFRNLQMWKNEFLYYADVKENVQFPFIVIGNKVIFVGLWRDFIGWF